MRIISWLFRGLLFLVALGFALSNTGVTELRFFGLEIVWRAPLVVFLLAFLAAGAVLGLLAVVPTWFRMRRELSRLRRELRVAEKTLASAQQGKTSPDAMDPVSEAQLILPPSP
jgi:putative membrane protein